MRSGKRQGKSGDSSASGRGGKIVRAEVCPGHVHMLVEIPPKLSASIGGLAQGYHVQRFCQYLRSRERNCTASLICSTCMTSLPAMSAMVRDTLRMRS